MTSWFLSKRATCPASSSVLTISSSLHENTQKCRITFLMRHFFEHEKEGQTRPSIGVDSPTSLVLLRGIEQRAPCLERLAEAPQHLAAVGGTVTFCVAHKLFRSNNGRWIR